MNRIRLRVGLQPSERRSLEQLTRERWQSWRLSETAPGDIGQGFRADALIIDTEQTCVRIGCLAVELPNHGESYRLQIHGQKREPVGNGKEPSATVSSSAQVVQALDVGTQPQLFLVWRVYEYPDEALASVRGMVVICADALLIRGTGRQLLIQVSRVPTWLTLSIDDKSIEAAIAAAEEVELLA
ncbi:MAG TPA: hypothetical protein VKC64_15355 [Burkholderiales bacterium]|nr:hypothetical protein [Burkholderiales bacterium]